MKVYEFALIYCFHFGYNIQINQIYTHNYTRIHIIN